MNVLSIFLKAYRIDRSNKSTIAGVQWRRLQELVSYSRQHSSYFKQLYKDIPANLTDISQLPITTKPVLMEHFNDWVTDPELTIKGLSAFLAKKETIGDRYLDKYYVCTTSGTTGHPAVIVHDARSRKVYSAIGFLRNLLPRVSLFDILTKVKAAAIVAIDGHFLGYTTLLNLVKRSKLKQKFLKIFSVLAPAHQLISEIFRFRPDVLVGYPTAIYLLAKEKIHRKIKIDPYVIITSGETLRPYMRETMQEAFGCVVINSYGSSEVPGLTSECKFQKLHLNSDWYILEIADERNILVTNLSNFAQPIIRYKISDYVTIDNQPCECGSPHPVISVIGRDDEILKFISASGKTIEVLPMAITTVAEESNGVFQSQILQKSANHIVLNVKALDGKDEQQVRANAKQDMQKFLDSQGLSNVIVEISDEYPRANPKSGKFRSIITSV